MIKGMGADGIAYGNYDGNETSNRSGEASFISFVLEYVFSRGCVEPTRGVKLCSSQLSPADTAASESNSGTSPCGS